MLTWKKLLNQDRRKELHGSKESMGTSVGRTESERDYDRILFATPTRRLADKTQVFPMEEHDSVRTRLTHSHEVCVFHAISITDSTAKRSPIPAHFDR